MIDNYIPRVRVYGEQEYVRACDWVANYNLKIHDTGFYSAFDFGYIRFTNVEDVMYFKFTFDGKITVFDPNGIDPDSIRAKQGKK